MPIEKTGYVKKREKKKAIRENRQGRIYSREYGRHSARQHSISPKMFLVVHRLAARGCQNIAAGCTLSAKLIPDWEDRESGTKLGMPPRNVSAASEIFLPCDLMRIPVVDGCSTGLTSMYLRTARNVRIRVLA